MKIKKSIKQLTYLKKRTLKKNQNNMEYQPRIEIFF